VIVLVHPTHALAEEAASGRALTTHALRGNAIIYPDLPQLEEFARNHWGRAAHRAGGVPAVINQVRTTRSLGLIPGWQWLLNELRQLYGLLAARLNVDEEMSLYAVLPHGGRQALSQHGAAYLADVEGVLQTLASDWQESEAPRTKLATILTKSPTLYIYHISKGPLSGPPCPRWREAVVEELRVTDEAVHARVNWGEIGSPQLAGRIVSREHARSKKTDFLLLTALDGQQRPPRAGSLCFSRRATRTGFAATDICLIGVFAYEGNDGRPTASPVILTSRRLGREDLESLERSHLVSLIAYGDADHFTGVPCG
jgi:hypothetical protein